MSLGLFSVNYWEIELNLVDRYFIFASIILSHSSKETLREIKPWKPENNRDTIINPVLEHFSSMNQVLMVANKWF